MGASHVSRAPEIIPPLSSEIVTMAPRQTHPPVVGAKSTPTENAETVVKAPTNKARNTTVQKPNSQTVTATSPKIEPTMTNTRSGHTIKSPSYMKDYKQ